MSIKNDLIKLYRKIEETGLVSGCLCNTAMNNSRLKEYILRNPPKNRWSYEEATHYYLIKVAKEPISSTKFHSHIHKLHILYYFEPGNIPKRLNYLRNIINSYY